MEVMQTQAKLDECMEQLSLKSKDLANTRSELVTIQQQHTQTEQQVILTSPSYHGIIGCNENCHKKSLARLKFNKMYKNVKKIKN
jgi:hypothetical protein